MKANKQEHLIAAKGLEDLLKSYEQEYLYDVYSMQGFFGLAYVLKIAPKYIYREVWTYIKQNKSDLKFYSEIPKDI